MRNERRHLFVVIMAGLMSLAINAQTPADSVAADFTMLTRGGDTLRLSQLPTDRLTLLIFYDPDCADCRQELFAMRHSSQLRRAVRAGRVQVLCVYAEQNDTLWRASFDEFPTAWMVAKAVTDVKGLGLYDLSGMPSLYLLDKSKAIIQQDYEFSELRERLPQ